MTQIIVEALETTGQRGIINKGWGGLGNCKFPFPFLTLYAFMPHPISVHFAPSKVAFYASILEDNCNHCLHVSRLRFRILTRMVQVRQLQMRFQFLLLNLISKIL